jgi:hypothetical protein
VSACAGGFFIRAIEGRQTDAPAAVPEGKTLEDARRAIAELSVDLPQAAGDVELMNNFLAGAARGIAR